MNSILSYLKNKRLVWQAHHHALPADCNSTGFSELDTELQGGFPQQGVIDIHSPIGIGELRLLLPNLLARQSEHDRLLVLIAPPMQVNSEMLAEFGFSLQRILIVQPDSAQQALWTAEQCLKSACCNAVLLWHQRLTIHQLKRLQLAAEKGDALHVILRQDKRDPLSLPVSLGLKLTPHSRGLSLTITKRKGGWSGACVTVDMQPYWPELSIQSPPSNILPFPTARTG